MYASASPKVGTSFGQEIDVYYNRIINTLPSTLKQKNTVIKYTKLNEFDFDEQVSWPVHNCMQPRLRRIILLDDPIKNSSRSLKVPIAAPDRIIMPGTQTKRKIATIPESDEIGLYPEYSRSSGAQSLKKTKFPVKMTKSISSNYKEDKTPQGSAYRSPPRLNSAKCPRETKPSVKPSNVNTNKDSYKHKSKCSSYPVNNYSQIKNTKDKEMYRSSKNVPKSKSNMINEFDSLKAKRNNLEIQIEVHDGYKVRNGKQSTVKPSRKSSNHLNKLPISRVELKAAPKPLSCIYVPIDTELKKESLVDTEVSHVTSLLSCPSSSIEQEIEDKVHRSTEIDKELITNDKSLETDNVPETAKPTETQTVETDNSVAKKEKEPEKVFESLDIPNVTLIKDKSDVSKEEVRKLYSQSLPNLKTPSLKIITQKEEKEINSSTKFSKQSFIIGRATVTYTTKQKINFQVVSSNEENSSLSPSPLAYPLSVVSVFKKEMRDNISDKELTNEERNESTDQWVNLKSLDCSYALNNNKLVKPSELISTIKVNDGLLQNDYICEQFQRELNFIDSFFESLQYLENCSLSDKCLVDGSCDKLVNNSVGLEHSEYTSFFSKFDYGSNIDSETMASKSLCLLNLLIRDEQRRAKNLLFVLKMREDALTDFTKSQLLWLENKKKQDNTDISTLKKKQRGALLKLQHECGEMQRMRKALLTLSEKRKAALLKTKNNIELKMRNNVNVEQILLGKKKLKRTASSERQSTPLKCFDLSSSGCDDSATSRTRNEVLPPAPAPAHAPSPAPVEPVASAEKCIQTGDSIIEPAVPDDTVITVDGGYLNILFHQTFPRIFSNGKQYEVNAEALKNIVESSSTQHDGVIEHDVAEKFMEQIKNKTPENDKSSTPSTARSLVDEFDMYYKGLGDDKSHTNSPVERDTDYNVIEVKDIMIQVERKKSAEQREESDMRDAEVDTSACDISCGEPSIEATSRTSGESRESVIVSPSGPLPVPAGAPAVSEATNTDALSWVVPKSSTSVSPVSESSFSSVTSLSSFPSVTTVSTVSTVSATSHSEAEELRRQQLAIEREIKALEQQQCQLLAVREIPDKPPPPYKPPADARSPKPPRLFKIDEALEENITKHALNYDQVEVDITDALEVFVQDLCVETVERQKLDLSDRPWDACNLPPQKQDVDTQTIAAKTTNEVKDILSGVMPSFNMGVSTRRSDHIDDILFSEWRRCEPEWTSLHVEEATVKNQVFESIFQRVLSETIDEYKSVVLGDTHPT